MAKLEPRKKAARSWNRGKKAAKLEPRKKAAKLEPRKREGKLRPRKRGGKLRPGRRRRIRRPQAGRDSLLRWHHMRYRYHRGRCLRRVAELRGQQFRWGRLLRRAYIADCNGDCINETWIGDNICDQGLLCEEFNFDGGDCPFCGDAICGDTENQTICPEDCGDSGCAEGEVISCDGSSCLPDTLGDGTCNPALNCLPYENDGGDCCPEGQVKGAQIPVSASWIGDGGCDSALNCADFQFDGGDCPFCGDGECNGVENAFTCADDCVNPCPDGQYPACGTEECTPSTLGDGVCDATWNCPEYEWTRLLCARGRKR